MGLDIANLREAVAGDDAILLAKLALDGQLQGQGLGAELLVNALQKCAEAGEIVGCRFVVVDAIDE